MNFQELNTKNQLVEQLTKANEKLRLEEKRYYGKGKENAHVVKSTCVISSPRKCLLQTKSANTTPASSPQKPLTPLRERNE